MGAKKKTKTKSPRKAMRRCSICRKQGHNHRTCPRKKGRRG